MNAISGIGTNCEYVRLEESNNNSNIIVRLFQKVMVCLEKAKAWLVNLLSRRDLDWLKDVPTEVFLVLDEYLPDGNMLKAMKEVSVLNASEVEEIKENTKKTKAGGEIHFADVLCGEIPALKEVCKPIFDAKLSLIDKAHQLNLAISAYLRNGKGKKSTLNLSGRNIIVVPEYFNELCENLISLDISNNNIKEMSNLNLPKILRLNISGNNIFKLSNLRAPCLKSLDISYNPINELPDHLKLSYINISNTKISDVSKVCEYRQGVCISEVEMFD